MSASRARSRALGALLALASGCGARSDPGDGGEPRACESDAQFCTSAEGVCGDGVCQELCGTCPADCGGCGGEPLSLVRGPYLQSAGGRGVTVRWDTAESSRSAVAYGPSPGELRSVVVDRRYVTAHEVRLEGLPLDTRVYYAFGDPERELFRDSGMYFQSPPEAGAARRVRVWAVGDAGTADAHQRAVRDRAVSPATPLPDVWLMLGDNAYPSGTDADYQRAFFDVYPAILRHVPVWPTLGNHDAQSASSAEESGPYYDMFSLPAEGQAGGVRSGVEAYYAFDWGPVHFVCLDSSDSDRSAAGPMLRWLEEDLAATQQPWIVAFFHHPPYSKGSHDSDHEIPLVEMRENALPVLEAYGVDLVLAGHSHSYERSFYLRGHYGSSDTLEDKMVLDGSRGDPDAPSGPYSRSADGEGAVYVVAGASGKLGGGSLDHPAMVVSLAEYGSLMVDVDGGSLTGEYLVPGDAQPHDRFRIVK